ncbi:MAG: carbonic anhydrase [Planctomycetota bacterium]
MRRFALLAPLLAASAACQLDKPAAPVDEVASAEDVAVLTPEAALQRLKEGNKHFVSRTLTSQDWKAQLEKAADGSFPYAAVLASPDPRIPLPLVFDAGIGDLISIRTLGPIATPNVIGAMEQSVLRAGVKAIVILGHSDSGAAEAACEGSDETYLQDVIAGLGPAVDATPREAETRLFDGLSYYDAVTIEHVTRMVADIRTRSTRLDGFVHNGDLVIVPAYYDIATGAVVWL